MSDTLYYTLVDGVPTLTPRWSAHAPLVKMSTLLDLRHNVYNGRAILPAAQPASAADVRSARGETLRMSDRRRRAMEYVWSNFKEVVAPIPVTQEVVVGLSQCSDGLRDLGKTLAEHAVSFNDAAVLYDQDMQALYSVTYEYLETQAKAGHLPAQEALDILRRADEQQQSQMDDHKKAKDKAYASGAADHDQLAAQNALLLEQVQLLKDEVTALRRAQVTGGGAPLGTLGASGPIGTSPAVPAGRRSARR